MTNTSITIHTDKQDLPNFRVVGFSNFTNLEITAGHSTINIHLAAGVTLAEILAKLCHAELVVA